MEYVKITTQIIIYILAVAAVANALISPGMRRRAKAVVPQIVKLILEKGYFKYSKTSQMELVLLISDNGFKIKAIHYIKVVRVIKKNLRFIVREKILTKSQIRYVLDFGKIVYPILVINGVLMILLLILFGLAKWA